MLETSIELGDAVRHGSAVHNSKSDSVIHETSADDARDGDAATLQKLGKRPMLNRSFGFMSILGLSCSAMCSWEGILVTSVPSFLQGGPAAVVWAFVIGWIGALCVTATMAELASIAPVAGGQYHWVAMMAPRRYAGFLTYMTAWLTTLSWQAMCIASSYNTATILQGIIVLARPGKYAPATWHTILIVWAHAGFAVVLNLTGGRTLARFEGFSLILHLAGFFAVLVPLVYMAPHTQTADFVFTSFSNGAGWSTQGLAFFVGLPSVATALIGADGAVHMAEEIQSAHIVVPRAIMYTIVINGALAFAIILGMMFSISDLEAAMEAAATMFYPFLQIFEASVKSKVGACIMAGIVWIMGLIAVVGVYASASRMLWSFSRDKGLPFDKQLVKLNGNALPVNAILTTLGITSILSLVALGSSVALSALLSLVVAALYSSYLLVCGLALWCRVTGRFDARNSSSSSSDYEDSDDAASKRLQWGPWRIPEPLGTINNVVACLYSALLLFWSFWPQAGNPTPATANWSILVFGAVVIFSVGWYAFRGRRNFVGPVKEI